ncbi:MAG: hypothetical protein OXD45_13275 [Rhodobacteraceae bacterium]|nr:hypothetical protein [Paracoccaceae bacterium]
MLEIIRAISPFVPIVTSVGSIATPILVLWFGFAFTRKQKEIDRKIKLEEQLRDDRIEIYNSILEPYIILKQLTHDSWPQPRQLSGLQP